MQIVGAVRHTVTARRIDGTAIGVQGHYQAVKACLIGGLDSGIDSALPAFTDTDIPHLQHNRHNRIGSINVGLLHLFYRLGRNVGRDILRGSEKPRRAHRNSGNQHNAYDDYKPFGALGKARRLLGRLHFGHLFRKIFHNGSFQRFYPFITLSKALLS